MISAIMTQDEDDLREQEDLIEIMDALFERLSCKHLNLNVALFQYVILMVMQDLGLDAEEYKLQSKVMMIDIIKSIYDSKPAH